MATTEPRVANTEQSDAWNGDEGEHWSKNADRYDAMTGAFNDHLFVVAAIAPTDVVLDIGCGCGQTTRCAARHASQGRATGVDLSAPMLERARTAATDEGITNVAFEQGDAQVVPFPTSAYDVVISRFGIMFFADPVSAFTNVAAALRPGGRLAVLCWRDATDNEWLMVPATAALAHVTFPDLGGPEEPGAFALADPARIDSVLTAAGFDHVVAAPVEAPMLLGRDAADAVEFIAGTGMARALLEGVDPATAGRALEAVTAALHSHETTNGVVLDGAAWLVTAIRP
jgi:ubiquinone/menaquinone biosynthesis C-methylase UbiE